MTTKSVAFSISDGSLTLASGTIEVDEESTGDTVVGISGSVNNVPIDGLSNYNNADNLLSERPEFFSTGVLYYGYGVDQNGLGFSAGGVQYDLVATPNTNNNLGQAVQSGDALISSVGQNETVSFAAGSARMLCFANRTRIETLRGKVPIEALNVGDYARTSSGECRPIRWIGNRVIASPTAEQFPIRIAAHAFGPTRPARDLFLSPGHPVLVGADEHGCGGHLVPIMCLVNGTTIERVQVNEITYWHVELDAHDILLAEGLPAESYIDLGSRAWFAGADGTLYDPDFAALSMPGRCRPVAIDGPVVEAERRRLDMVLVARLTDACGWPTSLTRAAEF